MSDVQPLAPAVSVVMAVLDGDRYLREAMDSILAQRFTDYEFIVIDDGSTDHTPEILKAYAAQDRRVRLITRPNRGLAASLNEGIELASGQFIARMDADDIAIPDRFEKQVDYLENHPQVVLVGARVLLIDPEGLPIRVACAELTHDQIDDAHLNRGWPVVHPAVMMRLSSFRQVGGYRLQYDTLEDLDLFLRLAEIGQLSNLPEVLLNYRQHFGSVTHRKFEQQAQLRQLIYEEAYVRRGQSAPPITTAQPSRWKGRFEQHRNWAWAALKAGNVQTARKHALWTLRQAPMSFESWRLAFCAVRGH